MSDSFSNLGKIEAIDRLYRLSAYERTDSPSFLCGNGSQAVSAARLFQEGTDFSLVYFPLKHLGYKCVIGVTGELYAGLAHPRMLSVVIGVSSKLDYGQVSELWTGITVAAKEHGYSSVSLDLQPSQNGLVISLSAVGESLLITRKRRAQAKSKDLICISGPLGAAYLGLRKLEEGAAAFEKTGEQPDMKTYKMIVGAYLRPELNASVLKNLEDAEIYPSASLFVTRGLADSVKRLTRDTGLGAKIYADKIPFEGNSFALGKELDIDPLSAAMNGGDDYRLLFVIPILHMEKFRRDFQTFDIIGHMALPEAGEVLVTPEGLEFPITSQAWQNNNDQ